MPNGPILIGGQNFNIPISTANTATIRLALQGEQSFVTPLTPLQHLNREFVAAQLSLASGGGPVVSTNVLWSSLRCAGLNFRSIILSNGATLTPNSMVKDLFMQAQIAVTNPLTPAIDRLTLATLFRLSHKDDLLGQCVPSGGIADGANLRQKVQNTASELLIGFPTEAQIQAIPDEQLRTFIRQFRGLLEAGTQATGFNNDQLLDFTTQAEISSTIIGLFFSPRAPTTTQTPGQCTRECSMNRTDCVNRECPTSPSFPCLCCVPCNLAHLACQIACVISR
jgi:hypothetical protein